MDINQLKYFISVAQTLNFTEAARRNGITQPSISHHINELEKQLGVVLFFRDRRSVTMTDAGREFLPYAIEIVQKANDAVYRVKQSEDGSKGRIAIAAVTTASETLSNCLQAFTSQYPDILVDIVFTTGRGQTITMNENKYDFYFAVQDMVPTGSTFEYIVSNYDRLVLALPKSHPFAKSDDIDFSTLQNEHFISISEAEGPALYSQIVRVCEHLKFKPNVINSYDSAETVLLAVGAGLGIAIVPEAITKVFYAKNVIIKHLDVPDALRTYVLAWHKQSLNPTAHLFLNVAKEVIARTGTEKK